MSVYTARNNRPHRSGRAATLSVTEVAIVALLACALVIAVASRGADTRPDNLRTTDVRVDAGQSLWSLASAHPVAGLTTAETAELIATLNQLDDSTVHVGDVLKVPSQQADEHEVAMR